VFLNKKETMNQKVSDSKRGQLVMQLKNYILAGVIGRPDRINRFSIISLSSIIPITTLK
jgi:hypothetical protein